MTNHQHDIEKYLKGELTPVEMHALEKKALNDPFLADALEGASSIHHEMFLKDVEELNNKISTQKETTFWRWTLRIAAGVAIVVASTYIVWLSFEIQPEKKQLALDKNEAENPKPIIKDSSSSATSGELSLATTEQPTAGSAKQDKATTSKPTRTATVKTKPLPTATTKPAVEPIADADLAEETKAEEIKATEPIAQTKPVEKEALDEAVKYKSADVQRAKKLSLAKDDQRKEAAPSMTESRAAGASFIASRTIRGKVTSTKDDSGVQGVNVVIKGSTIGTVTDEAGHYEIDVIYSNPTLVYSFIGLQSKELNAGDRTELDVALPLDAAQISEIVVTGYGSDESNKPLTVDLAHPSNGYSSFKQYLQQNIRYPETARLNKVEGHVTVEFTVEINGALSNFKIIHSISNGCDDELIRLIKEGPNWIPTKKDNEPIQDKAKVRLKFEMPK